MRVALLAKNVFPHLEISRNKRFTGGLPVKPSNQKQQRRGRSERTGCGTGRRIRSSQCVVEKPQPMRFGEIHLLTSTHPRQHIKISGQPTLVPSQQSPAESPTGCLASPYYIL